MKKWMALCLLVFLLPLSACADTSGDGLLAQAHGVLDDFTSAEYGRVVERFSADMRSAVDEEMLMQGWSAVTERLGAYQGVAGEQAFSGSSTPSVSFTLSFESGTATLTAVFDETGSLSGLALQPNIAYEPVVKALPEGALEAQATLFAGTEKELSASIVSPEGATDQTPYVLLVHGSGASDMDETIGPNKPFRDIAYDLAARGVGTMRFDKITYAHPELPVDTVEQEYLEPVREALRVLKAETNAARVYITGHSEGGILTPWLVRECGFSGGIALAGTPLPLWRMSYDQNLLSIALMPQEQQDELLQRVEDERAHAESLLQMSEEEARTQTVFGLSGYYLQYMEKLDQVAIARETQKPFLFLWGEADLQVNRAAYDAWKNGLGEGALYTYVTYPGLSHLFLPAEEGDSFANLQQAYMRPQTVDPAVAEDIARWLGSIA